MPRKRLSQASLVAFLWLICAASFANTNDNMLSFVGKAYHPDTDTLLYTEHHSIVRDQDGNYLSGEVVYKQANGNLMARKSLDFSDNMLFPDLEFSDLRTALQIDLQKGSEKTATLKLQSTDDIQVAKLTSPDKYPFVADAGFDRLVMKYWDKLIAGKTIKFEVLAITSGKVIAFQVEREELSNGSLILSISPRNWLIDLLMDPIVLAYDTSSKLLKEYQGVTNIAAEENGKVVDDHFNARIEYEYLAGIPKTPN